MTKFELNDYDDCDCENTKTFPFINNRIVEITSINNDAFSCRLNIMTCSLPLFHPAKRGTKKLKAKLSSTNKLNTKTDLMQMHQANANQTNFAKSNCRKTKPMERLHVK